MRNLTIQDIVAANFRNAFLDALPNFNIIECDDTTDARVLESCYKKTDLMSDEELKLYAECINEGLQLQYDIQTEDFNVIFE